MEQTSTSTQNIMLICILCKKYTVCIIMGQMTYKRVFTSPNWIPEHFFYFFYTSVNYQQFKNKWISFGTISSQYCSVCIMSSIKLLQKGKCD